MLMNLQLYKVEVTSDGPHSDSSAIHNAPPWCPEVILIKLQLFNAAPNTAPN